MDTIFFVDDDPTWHDRFVPFLRRQGYRVDPFFSFADALAAAEEPLRVPPDIALIDLRDEHANLDRAGLSVIEKLRDRWSLLPILVLSGLEDTLLENEAARVLADGYLTKGKANDQNYLLTQVKTRIALSRMRQEGGSTVSLGSLTYDLDDDRVEWKARTVSLTATQRKIVANLIIGSQHYRSKKALLQAANIPPTSPAEAKQRLDRNISRLTALRNSSDLSSDENASIESDIERYSILSPEAYAQKLDSDTLRRHITDIRKAFRKIDKDFDCLQAEHGEGYRWVPDPDDDSE